MQENKAALRFAVAPEIFEIIPSLCFGLVLADGIDNTGDHPEIAVLLNGAAERARARFEGRRVKDDGQIIPYREAFRAFGVNPNRYRCSIEALFTRISRGLELPHINPIVDLGNAVSLDYTLPVGAHDVSHGGEMSVRLAKSGDIFFPLEGGEPETPDEGEAVYAVGHEIRTRRWTWRQSAHGRIEPDTRRVFFPLDGFEGTNEGSVIAARDALARALERSFGCKTAVAYVNARCPSVEMSV